MPFKPNYRMQRSDRDRAKEARKQEKLLKRQEAVEKRKAARQPSGTDEPDGGPSDKLEEIDGAPE
jgi:hypothetical protein